MYSGLYVYWESETPLPLHPSYKDAAEIQKITIQNPERQALILPSQQLNL